MRPLGLGWPNLISVLRILLAPVVVVFALANQPGAPYVAAVVFVVAAATDTLDGYLARRWESHTRVGEWLDPLADKALVIAPLVALTVVGRFPLWGTLVIAAREVAVSLLRAWLGSHGRSMPASWWGKWKTATQMVVVVLFLLPLGPGGWPWRTAALAVTVALTVWSGLDYFFKARRPAPAPAA